MESKIADLTGATGTGKEYRNLIAPLTVAATPYNTVAALWDAYQKSGKTSNNKNGRIFEFVVCETLAHFGIGPLYYQCQFYGLPNDTYDIASWTRDGHPIIISCKTSLRERWKQADLEGRLLKFKFPRAESYLITLHRQEATVIRQKIANGEVEGLDQVYLADQPEFDNFVERMKNAGIVAVRPILPLTGKSFGGPASP